MNIYNERLLRLASYLEKLPRDKFRFDSWIQFEGSDLYNNDEFCGTKACALGHAALMPEFRQLGLRINKPTRSVCLEEHIGKVTSLNSVDICAEAANKVFG